MLKVARIAFNSAGWRKPTGDAAKHEAKKSYAAKFGFGHEEWLFRNEWLIDGWRYSFIQGVNDSHKKLAKAKRPLDVDLYTIQPDKKRRYVARIEAVEVLDDEAAEEALTEIKRLGWFDQMRREIAAVGGKQEALGAPEFAHNVLNVRFRLGNVRKYPRDAYADPNDPVNKKGRGRYKLYAAPDDATTSSTMQRNMPTGSTSPPNTDPVWRRPSLPLLCTPEERVMQARLMEELQEEYPGASIKREDRYIDITLQTEDELFLFELKSDLEPRTVMRQALGQLLEYAYHPNREHPDLPIRLVIVGRSELSQHDKAYLDRLVGKFSLPLDYRVVKA